METEKNNGLKKFSQHLAKHWQERQNFIVQTKKWVQDHNDGKVRLRDGKSLKGISHVEVQSKSGRTVHKAMTCFVPQQYWADFPEYGMEDTSKLKYEPLDGPERPSTAGYYVSGGWGRPHHHWIDDYVGADLLKVDQVASSKDGDDVAKLHSILKTKRDDKNEASLKGRLDVQPDEPVTTKNMMDMLKGLGALHQKKKKNKGKDDDDEDEDEDEDESSSSGEEGDDEKKDDDESSDGESDSSDSGKNAASAALGISKPTAAAAKPAAKPPGGSSAKGGGTGGGGGAPTRSKAMKPTPSPSPPKSSGSDDKPKIVAMDGHAKRLLDALQEIVATVLRDFDKAVDHGGIYDDALLWEDQELAKRFDEFAKTAQIGSTNCGKALAKALERLDRSNNKSRPELVACKNAMEHAQKVAEKYTLACKLTREASGAIPEQPEQITEAIMFLYNEVDLPLPLFSSFVMASYGVEAGFTRWNGLKDLAHKDHEINAKVLLSIGPFKEDIIQGPKLLAPSLRGLIENLHSFCIESVVLLSLRQIPKKDYESLNGEKVSTTCEICDAILAVKEDVREEYHWTHTIYEDSQTLIYTLRARTTALPKLEESLDRFAPEGGGDEKEGDSHSEAREGDEKDGDKKHDSDSDSHCSESISPLTRFMREHEIGRALCASARTVLKAREHEQEVEQLLEEVQTMLSNFPGRVQYEADAFWKSTYGPATDRCNEGKERIKQLKEEGKLSKDAHQRAKAGLDETMAKIKASTIDAIKEHTTASVESALSRVVGIVESQDGSVTRTGGEIGRICKQDITDLADYFPPEEWKFAKSGSWKHWAGQHKITAQLLRQLCEVVLRIKLAEVTKGYTPTDGKSIEDSLVVKEWSVFFPKITMWLPEVDPEFNKRIETVLMPVVHRSVKAFDNDYSGLVRRHFNELLDAEPVKDKEMLQIELHSTADVPEQCANACSSLAKFRKEQDTWLSMKSDVGSATLGVVWDNMNSVAAAIQLPEVRDFFSLADERAEKLGKELDEVKDSLTKAMTAASSDLVKKFKHAKAALATKLDSLPNPEVQEKKFLQNMGNNSDKIVTLQKEVDELMDSMDVEAKAFNRPDFFEGLCEIGSGKDLSAQVQCAVFTFTVLSVIRNKETRNPAGKALRSDLSMILDSLDSSDIEYNIPSTIYEEADNIASMDGKRKKKTKAKVVASGSGEKSSATSAPAFAPSFSPAASPAGDAAFSAAAGAGASSAAAGAGASSAAAGAGASSATAAFASAL